MTERLALDAAGTDGLDAVHALYADERVWRHAPQGRHTSMAQTRAMVGEWIEEWRVAGLGQWEARRRADGKFLGNVGCASRSGGSWWSLSYRLHPDAQGQGFATEAATVAISAARAVAPARPIIASLLEHNSASRRVAESVGMVLVHPGPDPRSAGVVVTRLLFADGPVSSETIDVVLRP